MSKLSSYINELVSFLVMLLLLAAIVSGQLYARADQLASAADEPAEITHVRLPAE